MAALLLVGVVVSGCGETTRLEPPVLKTRAATPAELERGEAAAASSTVQLLGLVQRRLGRDYEASVSVGYVSPRVQDDAELDASALRFDVVFVVTANPKSEPELRVRTNVFDSVSPSGGTPGHEQLDEGLAIIEGVASLPEPQRKPMASYVSTGTIAATSTSEVRLTPLGISWEDPSGHDPPVKKRLVEIARRHGYRLSDCVWLNYYDMTRDYPGSAFAQLLRFDTRSRQWVLVAARKGPYPAPVVEVK